MPPSEITRQLEELLTEIRNQSQNYTRLLSDQAALKENRIEIFRRLETLEVEDREHNKILNRLQTLESINDQREIKDRANGWTVLCTLITSLTSVVLAALALLGGS